MGRPLPFRRRPALQLSVIDPALWAVVPNALTAAVRHLASVAVGTLESVLFRIGELLHKRRRLGDDVVQRVYAQNARFQWKYGQNACDVVQGVYKSLNKERPHFVEVEQVAR